MNTGMLWFDNNPKTTLSAKVARAADYYRHKYGRDPNLCLVNPNAVSGSAEQPSLFEKYKITIRPYRPVLPGHLWIGIDDETH